MSDDRQARSNDLALLASEAALLAEKAALESQNQALQEDKDELYAEREEDARRIAALQERAEKAEAVVVELIQAHQRHLLTGDYARLGMDAQDMVRALSPTQETDPE